MPNKIRNLLLLSLVLLLAVGGAGCSAKIKKSYHLSRANRFYDANKYDRAEIEYLNVLRYDPQNSQAYGRLGDIYYDEGRLQRAMFFLVKASSLVPEDLDLRRKLGFIYSSGGLTKQALDEANYILQRKPDDEDATLLLAETANLPKEVTAARERLQAMAKAGDHPMTEVALGNLALREHDLTAAAAAYHRAQALDPKSSAVNGALASLAWAQGDLKLAATDYKAAFDSLPPRSPRRMQYVRFLIQTRDFKEGRQVLDEMLKTMPDYVPASLVLAEMALDQNKYDECESLLKKVLTLDPDNFDALLFEGRLDLVRGDATKAVADMERMARIYSQVPNVHYQLGAAYMAVNDLNKAAASLNRALDLNPNFVPASLLLAQVLIKNGNGTPAIVLLEKLLQAQPQLVQGQLLLADAYRLQGRVNDSLAIYDSLEKTFPQNEQISLLHGAALMQAKDEDGARTEFERTLLLSPTNFPALEQLVNLDLADKKFDAAMQRVNVQLQKNPNQVPVQILLAKIFIAEGKLDQAEAILKKASQIDPSNQGAYLLLAQMYSDAKENKKAQAVLDEAMAKEPKNTAALMLAASIYTTDNDFKAAAETYEKLLKIDPKYSPALNNLAYIDSEYLNNLDRAYELAQKARELLPFDPNAADTLGWINFKRGSYLPALGLLQESVAKLPTPEIEFHFGMANYMTGNETAARKALQQAGQSSDIFAGRDECQRCLAILDVQPATADATALAMLEKRISEKPDDPVAQLRLARIYQRDGKTEKAIAAYEAILQALPKNLNAMANLIQLYAAKDTKKAYDMAKTANKVAPYNSDISQALGRLAFLSGDYQLAASVLQPLAQNQPTDGMLLWSYAQAAYSVGKISEAQTALQSALSLKLPAPAATSVQQMLDLIKLAAAPAQAADASGRIAEILKSQPDNVPALMASATAAEFKNDPTAAAQIYEKVLTRYPDFTPAQKRLAWVYANDPTKTDRAYALASKARETSPDDPALAKIIGVILVKRGDYSHAALLLKLSASKLTNDPEVFYYLGTAQFNLKNRAESKANLQQALALKLSGPAAEAAKQMLTQLK